MINPEDEWFVHLLNGTTIRTSPYWPKPMIWVDAPDGHTMFSIAPDGRFMTYSSTIAEEITNRYGPGVGVDDVVIRLVGRFIGIKITTAIPYRYFTGDHWR